MLWLRQKMERQKGDGDDPIGKRVPYDAFKDLTRDARDARGARVVLRSGSVFGTVTSAKRGLLTVRWDDGTLSTISLSQLGNRDEQ